MAPIFLDSLFHRLVECVENMVKSMGLIVVSYANTSFLQLFMWERFKTLGSKLAEFDDTVEMVEIEEVNGVVKLVPAKPIKMRAERWSNLKQHKSKELLKYIDLEKHLVFRPYTFTPRGIIEVKLYAALRSDTMEISSKKFQ